MGADQFQGIPLPPLTETFRLMDERIYSAYKIILEDRVLSPGHLIIKGGRISAVEPGIYQGHHHHHEHFPDLILAPGFVDLHVHGGDGADFMDGTPEAFLKTCKAHFRHGTTTLLATSTAATSESILAFLKCTRNAKANPWPEAARVAGAHFYGPYFFKDARGCHPADPITDPVYSHYAPFLEFADCIITASVAPELMGAEQFSRDCTQRGIRMNAGHSHATFAQVEQSITYGVRHVDHLFCAMSDRARLRQTQTYPMRGGLLEATLFFDSLTTEVIADGKHLAPELLRLAYKAKGPDRLALVTDANRAMDMPDGEYWFGRPGEGELVLRKDGVGLTPDGKALASSVAGMDTCLRQMQAALGLPLPELFRMASLTPARIAGLDADIGSIATGKRADLVLLDDQLHVQKVLLGK